MKSPLRPVAVFAAFLLSSCLCLLVLSGPASAQPLPVQSHSAPPRPQSAPGPSRPSPVVPPPAPIPQGQSAMIPGPLRSFLRLAGISQGVTPEEVMPLLARNTYLLGYQGDTQTEFLRLVNRYIHQARELQIIAGSARVIQVANCADAGTLLRVLGYRIKNPCGAADMQLETSNPARAFLTIDSGFPLTQLEDDLQKGVPFSYPYTESFVPILYSENDWVNLGARDKRTYGSLLDTITNDPTVARLYWALAKTDVETGLALARAPGLHRLLPLGPALDFYGSEISIRSGRVLVPGGTRAESGWKELVGASPENPTEFVDNLLSKDSGWLALYFDTLSRVSLSQQDRFTQPNRMKHLYEAFHSTELELSATRGVFRKAPDLLLLFTRVEWDASGAPRVPGGVDAWKTVFQQKTESKVVREIGKKAHSWDRPEQLLDAITASARVQTDSGPLQMYLMLSQLDSGRPASQRLSADTVRLLASHFSQLSSWYLVFTEFPEISDESIAAFVKTVDTVDKISNQPVRGNTLGAFQANIGLWQVLARQGEIPKDHLDASLRQVIEPFATVSDSGRLFDAARTSLSNLLLAANAKPTSVQASIVDLLAGPAQSAPDAQQVHQELANRIRIVLTDQRLVSLDTLFALGDGLDQLAKGTPASDELLSLAGELRDFEMPRQIFTRSEKVEWAPGQTNAHHTELQSRIDLTKVLKTPGNHAALEAARGQLAPLLRDTLVGLNYAYYEPPGAQILHINPLFVRSHDFIGTTVLGSERLWQTPMLLGAGISAGGGGYLMGSLADLSYSLASAEQDLIAPEKVQALIWKELAPELLADAALTRWWNVSPNELHAVSLYQKSGEELLSASVSDPALRAKVTAILSDRMEPKRLKRVEQAFSHQQELNTLLPRILPSDTFYLGVEFRQRFPAETASLGPNGQQLEALSTAHPQDVSWDRISRDFGVPHPTMTKTFARELLNVKPFPFYGSYSSRLFGESWESGNLYWARLADEMGYSPVMLNRMVPELTRRMTGKIFATDLEDWPAMLRAMQEAGDELRAGKIAGLPAVKPSLAPGTPTTSLNRMVNDGKP